MHNLVKSLKLNIVQVLITVVPFDSIYFTKMECLGLIFFLIMSDIFYYFLCVLEDISSQFSCNNDKHLCWKAVTEIVSLNSD